MNKLWYLIVMPLILLSCRSLPSVHKALDEVESYIEAYPDSALHVLEDLGNLKDQPRSERARLALLYSIAQEKNGIHVCNDSLIKEAVRYYSRHGTPDDKLLAYLYSGLVYHNMGDVEEAMRSYVKGKDYVGKAVNIGAKAQLFNAIGKEYRSALLYGKAVEHYETAQDLWERVGNLDGVTEARLNKCDAYFYSGDLNRALSELFGLEALLDEVSDDMRQDIYLTAMEIFGGVGELTLLGKVTAEYIDEFDEEEVDWLSVCTSYRLMGKLDEAEQAMAKHESSVKASERTTLLFREQACLYDSLGLYKKSLEMHRRFSENADSLLFALIGKDTRFIEERHISEIRRLRTRSEILLIIVCCLALLLLLLIINKKIRTNLKQQRNVSQAYLDNCSTLTDEVRELSRKVDKTEHENQDTRSLLIQQQEILGSLIATEISGNPLISRQFDRVLTQFIADTDNSLLSIRQACSITHPKFIKYLQDRGLTEYEVEICCLYSLGLNGKEVKKYTKRSSHYNIVSEIRKKLGLGKHDTNLSLFIQNIIREGVGYGK